jgi:hypothetical protein
MDGVQLRVEDPQQLQYYRDELLASNRRAQERNREKEAERLKRRNKKTNSAADQDPSTSRKGAPKAKTNIFRLLGMKLQLPRFGAPS